MALVVRGWALEGLTCLGLLVTWRACVAVGGVGFGVLVFGFGGVALWRSAGLQSRTR